MAEYDVGALYNTKMPGYEDPADIQAAIKLYHYGSSTYDKTNTNPNNLIANSIAGHLNSLANSIAILDAREVARGIGSEVSNTIPTGNNVVDGYVWMVANSSVSGGAIFASAVYTNEAPTIDLVDGLIWVDKDAEPTRAYVRNESANTWVPLTELYNIIDNPGDMIYGVAEDDFAKLPIGSSGQVLTVSNNLPSWQNPVIKSWTQVATGTLSGSEVLIENLNAERYYIAVKDWSHDDITAFAQLAIRFNSDAGPNYINANGTTTSSSLKTPLTSDADTHDLGIMIDLANTAAQLKPVSTASNESTDSFFGYYRSPSAINSVSIICTSGEFDGGDYYVWSYK